MPRARINPDATACLAGDCDNKIVTAGYCNNHYTQLARQRARAKKLGGCTVKGCEREHKAKGYCQAHYRDVWLGRPTDKLEAYKASPCSIDDCDRAEYTSRLCRTHFEQKRKGERIQDTSDLWEFVKKEVVMSHGGTRVVGLRRETRKY